MSKKNHYWRFRFSCLKENIRTFFHFVKRLNRFRKLNQMYDAEPEFYPWVMKQYETVMNELTYGKLSKPSHSAETVLEEVWHCMDERYAGWRDDGNGNEV